MENKKEIIKITCSVEHIRFYKEQLDEYINNICKSLEDEFFITDVTIEDKFLIMGEYNIIKEASVIITYKMNRLS